MVVQVDGRVTLDEELQVRVGLGEMSYIAGGHGGSESRETHMNEYMYTDMYSHRHV